MSKNQIDYLYELIQLFPNIKFKTLLFLHLLAILKINIPYDKYSQELLEMTTMQIKKDYRDIYFYFDCLQKGFTNFKRNYNLIMKKIKANTNEDFLNNSSYCFLSRKNVYKNSEIVNNFSMKLEEKRHSFFQKIISLKMNNLYKDPDGTDKIKRRNDNINSPINSYTHSVFENCSKKYVCHNSRKHNKVSIKMSEESNKIHGCTSNKNKNNNNGKNEIINESARKKESSKKNLNRLEKIENKINNINEANLKEVNSIFSSGTNPENSKLQ